MAKVWDLRDGKCKQTFGSGEDNAADVNAVEFFPDGNAFGILVLFSLDTPDGRTLTLPGPFQPLLQMMARAICTTCGRIKVFRCTRPRPKHPIPLLPSRVRDDCCLLDLTTVTAIFLTP